VLHRVLIQRSRPQCEVCRLLGALAPVMGFPVHAEVHNRLRRSCRRSSWDLQFRNSEILISSWWNGKRTRALLARLKGEQRLEQRVFWESSSGVKHNWISRYICRCMWPDTLLEEEVTVKIAFLPACGPGHLNPMTALARATQARGHEVVVISTLDAEPFVHAAELSFLPVCERDSPRGSINAAFQRLGNLQGDQAMAFTFWLIANSVQSTFRDLPRLLKTQAIDAVVIDEIQSELGLVPRHLGLPYANASCALHFDMSGNTPLCVHDWSHSNTPEALARNRQGVQRLQQTIKFGNAAGKAYAEKVGLDIDWSDPLATISKLAWVTQAPKEFDFDGAVWPHQFHHTGPFHDGGGRIPSEFPWDRLTGEPLVYASMGTLQNGIEDVFTAIAEAVNRKPNVQLVISIGTNIDATRIGGLRDNTVVVTRAPQIEILKRAALCITHAGLNTVLETLAKGVPIVAIPVTNDQPGVAARVAHTATGKFVPVQQLTSERLSVLVDEVLENPVYRENALRLSKAIIGRNGLQYAVDLIERAFGIATETTSTIGRNDREVVCQ